MVYRVFIVIILGFYVAIRWMPEQQIVWVERSFYVWVSVFNLFVVSVFWGLMADLWSSAQGKRLFGIIDSMTKEERRNPKVIAQSRRQRIAMGSGVQAHEVNELVKQFDGMASIMKQMAGKGAGDRMRMVQQLQRGGMLDPGGRIAKQKKSTGKRLTSAERQRMKKLRDREMRRRKRKGKK